MRPRGTTFEFEYLRAFVIEFEKIQGITQGSIWGCWFREPVAENKFNKFYDVGTGEQFRYILQITLHAGTQTCYLTE